ncbi:MAG: hypothetical protein GY797_36595 [Deltaproteobacteria bacterium]|nr:hypothetical protein [Deltaproteobacteria bacterium]
MRYLIFTLIPPIGLVIAALNLLTWNVSLAQGSDLSFDTDTAAISLSVAITSTQTISNSQLQGEESLPLELRISRSISGSISGTLGVRGYDNIFYVTDNLEVKSGQVLTITQGTWLVFSPGTRFDIKGKLIGDGNIVFPVNFISSGEGGWEGLHFYPTAAGSQCVSCRLYNLDHGTVAVEVNAPITFKEGVIQDVQQGTAISSTVPFTLSNMLIDYVGRGLYISSTNRISQTASYLTLTRCEQGVVNQGQNLTLDNSIVTFCGTAVSTELSGTTTVRYSLFSENGQDFFTKTKAQLEQGPGLLYTPPGFVDFPKNFHLQPDSPSVNTADPAADYSREPGYNGSRADMGAYGNTTEATQQLPDDSQAVTSFDTLLQTGEPRQIVTYTVIVTHTGSVYDSYYLRASTGRDFRLRGLHSTDDSTTWRTHSELDDMQPGEQRQLEIGVEIPSYATNGMTNTVVSSIGGGYGATPIRFELSTVVSISTSIEQVSHVDIPAQKVVTKDNYVYIATGEAGLRVFDISNPTKPTEIGTYHNQSSGVWDVVVKDNYAFILFGNCDSVYEWWFYKQPDNCDDDLHILDVSNPKNIHKIGFYELPEGEIGSRLKKLKIMGTNIYITDGKGRLHIVDISYPMLPAEVRILDETIVDFDLSNGHLILLVVNSEPISQEGRITSMAYYSRLDILDAISLQEINSHSLEFGPVEYGEGIIIIGNLAFIELDYFCANRCNILGWQHIVDISNPWVPKTVDKSNPWAPKAVEGEYRPIQAYNVVLDDSYVYLAGGKTGVRIIDIEDPIHLVEVDSFGANPSKYTIDVAVSGNYIFLANGEDGLSILQSDVP